MSLQFLLRIVCLVLVMPLTLAGGCSTAKSPVHAYGGDPRPDTEVVRFIVPSALKVVSINRRDLKVPDMPGGQYEVHTLPGKRELMVAYEEYLGDATSGGIKTTDAFRFEVDARAGDIYRFAHNGPDNPIDADDLGIDIEIWLDDTKTGKRYAAVGAAGYGSFINRGLASLGGGGVVEPDEDKTDVTPAEQTSEAQGTGAAAGAAAAGAAAATGGQDSASGATETGGDGGAAATAESSAAQGAENTGGTAAGATVVAGGAAVAATASAGADVAGTDVSGSETLKRLQYWWLLAGQEARRGFLWWTESEAPRISTAHGGAGNVAGSEAEPGGPDTLQNLKHWWLRANAQEHTAFRDWIAQPDVVSPQSSGS
ncbi:MAG: DUF2057 family protein [Pseudomonadota bacterium]|nr:MAG: DUF2057 family protein [Pseudomonadota bacterium]